MCHFQDIVSVGLRTFISEKYARYSARFRDLVVTYDCLCGRAQKFMRWEHRLRITARGENNYLREVHSLISTVSVISFVYNVTPTKRGCQ